SPGSVFPNKDVARVSGVPVEGLWGRAGGAAQPARGCAGVGNRRHGCAGEAGLDGTPRAAGLGLGRARRARSPRGRSAPLRSALPAGLAVLQALCGDVPQLGVFCTEPIPKGVRFGPFQGRVVNTSEIKTYDDNSLMWEVDIFEDGRLSHFIDGRGAAGNWMSLVNCARFPEEQNLTAVQCQGQIFYETCKEILPEQELLVWYGDCYLQFLGIPLSLKGTNKHLKYTRCVDQGDRKFPCHLCDRSFEKRDRLRIHILHCSVCGKSFSQSSSLNKHMRVHSGERPYKCVYSFASHAAHDSHVRRTHKGGTCLVCGKHFLEQEEFRFHMKFHTTL
uniref:PR/SET domain 14 n=1 Tax=Crocodylus porosus TaxID=8502 RepID=A0A7M4FN27_CROPO